MTHEHETESRFLQHEPCPACSSRDALARYDDGHGFCFSCKHHEKGDGTVNEHTPTYFLPEQSAAYVASIARGDQWRPVQGEAKRLEKRGINEETCAKWGYKVGEYNGRPVQIANYIRDGAVVAQKLRFPDKTFTFLGKPKEAGLYGMHLWRDGGRKIVITEGEIDALSVSQLQDNRWPVVSLPNGAQAAKRDLTKHIEWLERFDEVILMLDNDEPGNAAMAECAGLFTPGKCKIARLPMKDANEMLQAGRGGEVIDAIWGAKEYRPDGIVSVADVVEDALRDPDDGFPWCFDEVNEWTFGRRPGEVIAVGAGTGVGKTDLFTQQLAYDVGVLKITVGAIFMEQPPRETVRRVAGKMVQRVLHVPGECPHEEREAAIRELAATNRFHLYNHFGASDWETIKSKIRFMVVALGCKVIYLDHLTALAASEEDEKKALDGIMAQLAGQAQELGHVLMFISHLTTPEGKPHEEGGRVTIRQFRGSRSIGFWSHFMFGLERNQQAEDEEERATTVLRCLKDRNTGRATGKTLALTYDQRTGMLLPNGTGPGASPFQPRGDF